MQMLNNLFLFHTFLPGVRTTPGLLFYSSGSSPAFSIIKDIKICLVFTLSYIILIENLLFLSSLFFDNFIDFTLET